MLRSKHRRSRLSRLCQVIHTTVDPTSTTPQKDVTSLARRACPLNVRTILRAMPELHAQVRTRSSVGLLGKMLRQHALSRAVTGQIHYVLSARSAMVSPHARIVVHFTAGRASMMHRYRVPCSARRVWIQSVRGLIHVSSIRHAAASLMEMPQMQMVLMNLTSAVKILKMPTQNAQFLVRASLRLNVPSEMRVSRTQLATLMKSSRTLPGRRMVMCPHLLRTVPSSVGSRSKMHQPSARLRAPEARAVRTDRSATLSLRALEQKARATFVEWISIAPTQRALCPALTEGRMSVLSARPASPTHLVQWRMKYRTIQQKVNRFHPSLSSHTTVGWIMRKHQLSAQYPALTWTVHHVQGTSSVSPSLHASVPRRFSVEWISTTRTALVPLLVRRVGLTRVPTESLASHTQLVTCGRTMPRSILHQRSHPSCPLCLRMTSLWSLRMKVPSWIRWRTTSQRRARILCE